VPVKSRLLLVNSTVAFALALMLTITVHEFGHALTALAVGLRPTVRPFSIDYTGGSTDQVVVVALAGPAVSLVTGILFLFASRALASSTFWYLVVLWLGALGIQECAGYLMTGPFVPFGDIGKALGLLAAPGWVYAAGVVLGLVGTVLLGRVVTRRLLELTDASGDERSGQLRSLGLFAWLLGSVIALLVGGVDNVFSGVGFFEILGTLTIGLFLVLVRFFMRRVDFTARGAVVGWPVIGIVLLVVLAVVRHFALGPGITL
jgi:hypothetical protein